MPARRSRCSSTRPGPCGPRPASRRRATSPPSGARLEAAEAHAETAEERARAAETQVEELELWLNRIEALLSEELAAPGLPAADDPFDGLLGSQDGGRRELYDRQAPHAADIARPAAERGRPGGLRSAIAALRRIVAVP